MSGLISSQISKHKSKKYICDECLIFFTSEENYLLHVKEDCNIIRTILPDTKIIPQRNGDFLPSNICKFKKFQNKLRVPFVAFADFESILKPTANSVSKDLSTSFTNNIQEHVPYAFAYTIVCSYDSSLNIVRKYIGIDCASPVFVQYLMSDVRSIYADKIKPIKQMLPLTDEQKSSFENAEVCHIWNGRFDDKLLSKGDKVMDHCHLSGLFRSAAHNAQHFIPVFFYNVSGYVGHMFIKELSKEDKINVIPNTMEKYISITKSFAIDIIIRMVRNGLFTLIFDF